MIKFHNHTPNVNCEFIGQMDNLAEDPDLIIFTGGADVNPELYNDKLGRHTKFNEQRDKLDLAKFTEFRTTPKLGICRGSQFLTVMAGGKLVQHVTGHAIMGVHPITVTGLDHQLKITSTHHQMMYPWNLSTKAFSVLGYSVNLSNTYLDGENNEMFPGVEKYKEGKAVKPSIIEPEIVYYPKINALCVQGHPEYMACPQETKDYVKMLTQHLVDGTLEDYLWSKEKD